MTQRLKTIEYAFPSYSGVMAQSGLVPGDNWNTPFQRLYIPETTNRTFKSVALEVSVRDGVNTASSRGSMASWTMGLDFGGSGYHTATVTDTISDTGEHTALIFARDVTNLFASGFASQSSCDISSRFSFTKTGTNGPAYNTATSKLILTYEYDDANANTRIKTIKYPLESASGFLGTTGQGTLFGIIPVLNTWLPESGKVFRNIFLEVDYNNAATTTVTHAMTLYVDSTAYPLPSNVNACDTAILSQWIQSWSGDQLAAGATGNAFDPTASHSISFLSSLASRYRPVGAILNITYEYDHTNSTQIMNEILLPFTPSQYMPNLLFPQTQQHNISFFIEENNPQLAGGALCLYGMTNGAITYGLNINNGSSNPWWTYGTGTATTGHHPLYIRIDGSGMLGITPSFTLNRGINNIDIKSVTRTADATTIAAASMPQGFLLLNYISDKHPSGDGCHNHYVKHLDYATAADAQVHIYPYQCMIPENNYFVQSAFVWRKANAGNSMASELNIQASGTELGYNYNNATVYLLLPFSLDRNDGELGLQYSFYNIPYFKYKYPSSIVYPKLDIKKSRYIRNIETAAAWKAYYSVCTYHSIEYAVSGQIVDYGGDGYQIPIRAYTTASGLAVTNNVFYEGYTASGGYFNIPWYDNVYPVYVTSRQDSTHVGRSDDGVAYS